MMCNHASIVTVALRQICVIITVESNVRNVDLSIVIGLVMSILLRNVHNLTVTHMLITDVVQSLRVRLKKANIKPRFQIQSITKS